MAQAHTLRRSQRGHLTAPAVTFHRRLQVRSSGRDETSRGRRILTWAYAVAGVLAAFILVKLRSG